MNSIITSVYKTSIGKNDLERLKLVLDNFVKITKWNTDLEDCDNILRIESPFRIESEVIKILNTLKIKCLELK